MDIEREKMFYHLKSRIAYFERKPELDRIKPLKSILRSFSNNPEIETKHFEIIGLHYDHPLSTIEYVEL